MLKTILPSSKNDYLQLKQEMEKLANENKNLNNKLENLENMNTKIFALINEKFEGINTENRDNIQKLNEEIFSIVNLMNKSMFLEIVNKHKDSLEQVFDTYSEGNNNEKIDSDIIINDSLNIIENFIVSEFTEEINFEPNKTKNLWTWDVLIEDDNYEMILNKNNSQLYFKILKNNENHYEKFIMINIDGTISEKFLEFSDYEDSEEPEWDIRIFDSTDEYIEYYREYSIYEVE